MTLRLNDKWVWDFWVTRDQDEHHIFYLQAPRSLGDPALRHRNASVGHAVSTDLRDWTVLPDALHPGEPGTWDDIATWTGSVIKVDGRWQMLYTGISSAEDGLVQRIGLATSEDLIEWQKHPANPVLEADSRWYELLDLSRWRDQSWRDPWLFRTGSDEFIHALITARSPIGPADGAGVVAHARSLNMVDWEVLPPVTEPGEFAQVEVPQLVTVDGARSLLLISCLAEDHSRERLLRTGEAGQTGTFVYSSTETFGEYRASDQPVTRPDRARGPLYAGKVVHAEDGRLGFMAFRGNGDESFLGELIDPLPVRLEPQSGLAVEDDEPADHAGPAELAPEVRRLIAWGTEVAARYGDLEVSELRSRLQPEHDQEMRRLGLAMEPVAAVSDRAVAVAGGEVGIRLFLPEGPGPHPVFVHFHGGGWVFGTIDSVINDAKCSRICREAGCAVATVEYRLAPEHRFPTAAEDCYAALRFVVDNADELELDPDRVAVGGESAGGNLAAVVSLMARDRGGPKLALQVLEVPVTDVTSGAAAYPSAQRFATGYGLDQAEMEYYAEQYASEAEVGDPYVSPIVAEDLSGLPPAHVLTAEYDVLRDSGEAYAQRLRDAGVDVTLARMPGQTHGSPVLWQVWEPAAAWMRSITGALAHGLHRKPEEVL
jgi:beta-fructofuranosidase